MIGDLQKELKIWLTPLVHAKEWFSLDKRLAQIAEAEMQVECGDLRDVFSFYAHFAKDDVCYLPAARCALLWAIGNDEIAFFDRVRNDLLKYPTWCKRPQAAYGADLLKMWLFQVLHVQFGEENRVELPEISDLPREWRSLAIYIEMLAFLNQGDCQSGGLLAKALVDLEYGYPVDGLFDLYLKRIYAQFCQELGQAEACERWSRTVVEKSCERGWIRPLFGLSFGKRSGTMQVLAERYPSLQRSVQKNCKRYLQSLVGFHNHISKSHVVEILSPLEFYVAQSLKRGYTYKEIARILGVSLGRVNFLVLSIYGRLGIHSRTELEPLVW